MNARPETPTETFKWRIYKVGVWAGPLSILAWGIAYYVAGWLPDIPGPQPSAEEVAQMFEENRTGIRIGLIIIVAASAWIAPFCALISAQMRRIEGSFHPLTYIQLAMAALLVFEFVMPMMMMQAAAYREDRPAWDILLIYDVVWMLFVGIVCTAFMQFLVIGLAIFQDRRPEPIFPRWAGYVNIWAAFIIGVPGSFLVFFKDGPFAWDGLIVWWVVVFTYLVWMLTMAYVLNRALDRQRAEGAGQTSPDVEDSTAELAELRAELARVARLAEAGSAPAANSASAVETRGG